MSGIIHLMYLHSA